MSSQCQTSGSDQGDSKKRDALTEAFVGSADRTSSWCRPLWQEHVSSDPQGTLMTQLTCTVTAVFSQGFQAKTLQL
eukprot:1147486-Pelagomonas_calceolata.AAC.4